VQLKLPWLHLTFKWADFPKFEVHLKSCFGELKKVLKVKSQGFFFGVNIFIVLRYILFAPILLFLFAFINIIVFNKISSWHFVLDDPGITKVHYLLLNHLTEFYQYFILFHYGDLNLSFAIPNFGRSHFLKPAGACCHSALRA
jgi:hypothetical protein